MSDFFEFGFVCLIAILKNNRFKYSINSKKCLLITQMDSISKKFKTIDIIKIANVILCLLIIHSVLATQPPDKATYIISINGSIINAKNTNTGQIEFTGKDISDILRSINNAIIDGGTISIQGGTYTPSSPVTFTKSIKLIANGNVIFNWNKRNQYLFVFTGSKLSTTALKADVASGTNTIIVENVSTAIPGDLLFIYDNTIWNTIDFPSWKTGELHEISSIYGSNITIKDGTINKFQVAKSGSVILIRPITIDINGIIFNGGNATADYRGIKLYYNKNSVIQNGLFQNNGLAEIDAVNSYNTTVKNNTITNNIMDGYGYGVSVSDGSAFTTITNNYFSNCRHCVTLGGNGVVGQSRETMVSFNTFADGNGTGTVLDSHNIAESYYIYNNTIYNPSGEYAVYSGAKVTKINGNHIIGGLGFRPGDTVPYPGFVFDVVGNTLENSQQIFIYEDSSAYQINIKDNIITGDIKRIAKIYNASSFTISGNRFESTNINNGDSAIYINSGTNGMISNNSMNNIYYEGIVLINSSHNTVSGNTITNQDESGSGNYNIEVRDSTYNTISGNYFKSAAYGIIETRTSDYNNIYDNDLSDVTSHKIEVIGRNTLLKNNLGYNE